MDATTGIVMCCIIIGGISLFLILDTIRLHRLRWARKNIDMLGR